MGLTVGKLRAIIQEYDKNKVWWKQWTFGVFDNPAIKQLKKIASGYEKRKPSSNIRQADVSQFLDFLIQTQPLKKEYKNSYRAFKELFGLTDCFENESIGSILKILKTIFNSSKDPLKTVGEAVKFQEQIPGLGIINNCSSDEAFELLDKLLNLFNIKPLRPVLKCLFLAMLFITMFLRKISKY